VLIESSEAEPNSPPSRPVNRHGSPPSTRRRDSQPTGKAAFFCNTWPRNGAAYDLAPASPVRAGQRVKNGGLTWADTENSGDSPFEPSAAVPSEVLNRFQRSQVGQKSGTSNQILIWYTARIA
jgi:hypothetical protein